MSYQVLARKWRPRDFASMVGQSHVVRALANALDGDRVHHAFLFTGTRGVGKTTVARILAKCLNCDAGVSSTPCGTCSACTEIDEGRFVDLIEVDAASRSKVDETRELMDNVQFAPARGRYKVYLIDEVHMFSEKSFNALLKTLEEPPPHVKFLLATTDPQKLPITVLSRCLQFNLKRLPADAIAGHLARILEAEAIEHEPAALALLARAADGSMRDALSLLDQAIAFGGGRAIEAEVRAMIGSLDRHHVLSLLEGLAEGDPAELLARIEAMAGDVTDYAEALAELLSELQRLAVLQAVPDAPVDDDESASERRALAERIPPADVQLFYQIGLHARRDLPLAPDPRGGFEMALLRMLAFRPAGDSAVPAASAPSGPQSRSVPAAAPAAAASAPAAEPAGEAPAPVRLEPERWVELVAELSLAGLTRELAANCSLTGVDGDHLDLVLAPQHEQLRAPGLAAKLEQALAARLGRRVRLRFHIATPSADTPASRERRDAAERHASAVRAIEEDPGVRALCETFDAEIDASQVRPA